MKNKISLLAASGALVFVALQQAQAQNFEDALRYSALSSGTTARSMAIGGAAGSLGADYSAASVNPAGLSLYRQSEFTITPYLSFNNSNANYIGTNVADNNTAFKLGNMGLVLASNDQRKNGWKNVTFALGFNKLADFNTNYTYQGLNGQSSYSEIMAADAQDFGVNEQDGPMGFLGYQGYLLNDDRRSIPYRNVIDKGQSVLQTKYSHAKGAVNEYNLSLAGNYNDKFMIGGTIGITQYRFKRTNEFVEADNSGNTNNDFESFSISEILETTGIGINGKFGFIYSASPLFRFGASVHTPTFGSYTDYVDYNLSSRMEGLGSHQVAPQNLYRSDYSITIPMRAVVSATGFFGTKGFITGDVEYVPYNTMRIRYDGAGNQEANRLQNDYIKNNFRGVINGRLGLEIRANKALSLRAGGAYYANPYTSGINDRGGDRLDLSLGLGFRFNENTYLDITYVNRHQNYKDRPYEFPATDVTFYDASIKENRNLVGVTLGFKF